MAVKIRQGLILDISASLRTRTIASLKEAVEEIENNIDTVLSIDSMIPSHPRRPLDIRASYLRITVMASME
jgi:hypothetical protein